MELKDRLKQLQAELATAAELEKIHELSADITRCRRAIMVSNELRSAALPSGSKACGATAVEERRMSTEDAEQWKWEAEWRMAHGKADEVSQR